MRQGFYTHSVCVHRRISRFFRRWREKQRRSFLNAQNVYSSHTQLKSQGLKKDVNELQLKKKS